MKNKKKKKIQKKEEICVVPAKNYIKVSIIFIATIAVVLTAFIAYDSHKKYIRSIPVIRGSVTEIVPNDLDTHFTEYDDFLLYVGVADDSNCRELEEDLIPMLKKRNIKDFVYLNITDVESKVEFFEDFNDKYATNIEVSNYPAVIIISDKKIVDLVQKGDKYLNVSNVEQLFDEYEVTGVIK